MAEFVALKNTVASAPPPAQGEAPAELSLVKATNVILRHRRLIIGVALLLAVPAAILTLMKPRIYASTSRILPQTQASQSMLAGLASQFGLGQVGAADPGQSPAFYMELLRSKTILGAAVDSAYNAALDTNVSHAITLKDYYGIEAASPEWRRHLATEALGGNVAVAPNTKTGVIQVTVRAEKPKLAQAINAQLLALVNDYNLRRRQSQAATERRFVEQRLAEVREDLRRAEDALQSFLQRNRNIDGSLGGSGPQLTFERNRLERAVALHNEIYTTLMRSYEQAKIDEVRDTPVFTVVEPPELPLRPEGRGVVRRTLAALVGGLLLGVVLAFLLEYSRAARVEQRDSVSEFQRLLADTRSDLLHPWRPIGEIFSRRKSSARSRQVVS